MSKFERGTIRILSYVVVCGVPFVLDLSSLTVFERIMGLYTALIVLGVWMLVTHD